jgi:hypothetical protein
MNFMTYQEPEREKQRIQSIREERNTRKTKEEGKPKSRPRSIATVHRELSFMRRILNVAVANGWIMRNPFTQGESLIRPGDESPRERIISRDEVHVCSHFVPTSALICAES